MPLPTVRLDDRRFQDIVDEAKSMITRYCPEWTDHNVSDPGVTLIELFAWMTDMLLYRVNQIPDAMYVNFLGLIGVRLEPPQAARTDATFYLSAAQPNDVTLPKDTEVATIRTETSPAIVFTTDADVTIRPPRLAGAFSGSGPSASTRTWIEHELPQLGLPGQRIPVFPPTLTPGDALYVAFAGDQGNHVLAFVLTCETAGGAGVDPTNPPFDWEVWRGGETGWARCVVEFDGTGGFNQSGEIVLRTPAMAAREINGTRAFWLRCRLNDDQASGENSYRVSPDIERLSVEARGGTVGARHAITVRDELLGQSDGTPGQTFRLLNTPLLARPPHEENLIVEISGGEVERWREETDFADAGRDDHCFTLDNEDGTLTLGPSLLQPDGNVYRFGAVPPKGSTLRFDRYQYGGGMIGNIPAGALSVLKTSIPYITRAINWEPALGGRNAETLAHAKLRAPHMLRTRTRAVTADDYEYLASQLPGVARAHCITPGAQPGTPGGLPPGQVAVVVLPQIDEEHDRITPERLTLSAELRAAVLADLNQRRVIGTSLDVRAPQYQWVSIQTTLQLAEGSSQIQAARVIARAETELYRFLNPYRGGPRGEGWPFGRDLHVSEIYGLLLRVPDVESVEDVQIRVSESGNGANPRSVGLRLTLLRDALICSGRHDVRVR